MGSIPLRDKTQADVIDPPGVSLLVIEGLPHPLSNFGVEIGDLIARQKSIKMWRKNVKPVDHVPGKIGWPRKMLHALNRKTGMMKPHCIIFGGRKEPRHHRSAVKPAGIKHGKNALKHRGNIARTAKFSDKPPPPAQARGELP
jgi:hypothetical protein